GSAGGAWRAPFLSGRFVGSPGFFKDDFAVGIDVDEMRPVGDKESTVVSHRVATRGFLGDPQAGQSVAEPHGIKAGFKSIPGARLAYVVVIERKSHFTFRVDVGQGFGSILVRGL